MLAPPAAPFCCLSPPPQLGQLASLLDGCLQLDPAQRLTVEQAFYHPFVYSDRQREAKEQKELEKQVSGGTSVQGGESCQGHAIPGCSSLLVQAPYQSLMAFYWKDKQ